MNDDTIHLEISGNGNFLRIEPLKWSHPNAEMDWDKNWITVTLYVKAGAFHGEFGADFMTIDFINFRNELIKLYDNLNGIARFHTLEEQIGIQITGDGFGHLTAECFAMDYSGIGNKLQFEIDFDQSYIPIILKQLEVITSKFPKIGELT